MHVCISCLLHGIASGMAALTWARLDALSIHQTLSIRPWDEIDLGCWCSGHRCTQWGAALADVGSIDVYNMPSISDSADCREHSWMQAFPAHLRALMSRLSFPATGPPHPGTDFLTPGSLTHHRSRHLLGRFLKGF